jgi:glutathione S-transferase
MELLEGRIKQSGGPYLLGTRLSLADLYIRAPLCDVFANKQFDGLDCHAYLAQFERVQACGEEVLQHPLIKAYHQNYKS